MAPCPLLRGPDSWARAAEEGRQLLIFQDWEREQQSPGGPQGPKGTTAAHLDGQKRGTWDRAPFWSSPLQPGGLDSRSWGWHLWSRKLSLTKATSVPNPCQAQGLAMEKAKGSHCASLAQPCRRRGQVYPSPGSWWLSFMLRGFAQDSGLYPKRVPCCQRQ